MLNAGDIPANIEIMIYFSDREPIGPFRDVIEARRTKHIRFNDLDDPEEIPRGVDYSSTITSDAPVVIQHTRLDSRQRENALMTTIGFSQ